MGYRVDRLAIGVLDLGGPDLLDFRDDGLRHRNVVQFLGHLVAFRKGPSKELERLVRDNRVSRLLGEQDEGRAGNRPGRGARLIGEDDVKAIRIPPIRAGGGSLE